MPTLDPKVQLFVVLLLWIGAVVVVALLWRRMRIRQRNLDRMYAEEDAQEQRIEDEIDAKNFLARWLHLAGYRSRGAPGAFVLATIAATAFGIVVAIGAEKAGLVRQAMASAGSVPGGIGDLAQPVLALGPWIVVLLCAALPWSLVSSKRKQRVRDVEQDMPVTLELLATMSESGLGFDAALAKAVESQKEPRPLFEELGTFQLEVLGGISRVLCFRRLARRLEVPSMTIFVSALVQAEQVGAGFSNVLRSQADDLRNRRREDANMLAQALPVKLIFPLVICFLPAIFVITLGPIFLQFLQLAEGMSRGR
jgi:tight adherence protein C